MKLEVEVPEEEMRLALADIAGRLFARGESYGAKGGEGYRALLAQATAWVAEQDFTGAIQAEADRQLRSVLADVVRARLQAEVKRQAIELARQVQLLPDTVDGE